MIPPSENEAQTPTPTPEPSRDPIDVITEVRQDKEPNNDGVVTNEWQTFVRSRLTNDELTACPRCKLTLREISTINHSRADYVPMMKGVDSVIEETNGDGTTWAEPCPHVWKQSVDIDTVPIPSGFKDVELWRFFDWGRGATGTESGGVRRRTPRVERRRWSWLIGS